MKAAGAGSKSQKSRGGLGERGIEKIVSYRAPLWYFEQIASNNMAGSKY